MRADSKILSSVLTALFIVSFSHQSFILAAKAEEETINISPVVQLVSYKDIYGKYVEMYGWGSASVISDDGVIISNNHVVDNGKGKLASAFNVCVTAKIGEKPSCNYTATLIARDETMDVSLLKIDPTDIFGNAVDYTKFKSLDIDFDYSPKTQDEMIIIGYPWIGSETITETKGIVSGLSEYNGYQYIKTDATIAGGNSGGAMINKQGKLVGLPTYTVGWESALGYGLHLKEAEEFIKDNINVSVIPKKTGLNFSEYQKTLETINKSLAVEDDLFKFTFGKDYEVKNYIKNRYLDFNTKTQKEVSVGINMELISLPNLTEDRHFWYYVQNLGIYNKDYQNLNQKKIGGISFYSPVYKSDVSQGNADYVTMYFAKLSPQLMLKMEVYAPLYDEKNNAKVKKETDSVLSGFTFKTDKLRTLESNFTFNLASPMVQISTSDLSSKNDRYGFYIHYLNNLHEYFTVSLQEQNLYSGKGQTPEDIYKIETLDSTSDYKSMINFMGHKGYVLCEGYGYYGKGDFYGPVYSYYGNYYYQYGNYGYNGKDENDVSLPTMTSCTIKILEGLQDEEEQEYALIISLNAAIYNIKDALQETFDFMRTSMKIKSMGSGQTDLVNVYNKQISLSFTDIADQNEAYKSFLKILIKYGLLKNKPTFDGNYGMTWKDVVPIYLKAIYNVDLTKDAPNCKEGNKLCLVMKAKSVVAGQTIDWNDLLIKKMKLDMNAYVPYEKLGYFDKVLHYRLAGLNLGVFSEKDLMDFDTKRMEKKYKADVDKLDKFDNLIYGKRKIALYEVLPSAWVTPFQSDYYVTWSPSRGLRLDPVYSTQPYNFNPPKKVDDLSYYSESAKQNKNTSEKIKNDFDQCLKSGKNTLTCVQTYVVQLSDLMKSDEQELFAFTVLTKANLYDYLSNSIDFGLFDSELAKKKDSQINEGEEVPIPTEVPKE